MAANHAKRFGWGKGDIDIKMLPEKGSEPFADLRGAGTPGRKSHEIAAVNAYQKELEQIYDGWADEWADDIAQAPEEERDGLIEEATLALVALLVAAGRRRIPQAVDLGLDGKPLSPGAAARLAAALESNETLLRDSLGADLQRKLRNAFSDPDVQAALAAGAGAVALQGVAATLAGRVASYAGGYWAVLNQTRGEVAKESGIQIFWRWDDSAQHCTDCLHLGNRTYDSWDDLMAAGGGRTPANGVQCDGNCRCELEFAS